jgi:uncharacterized RDD family membrane protein YckC
MTWASEIRIETPEQIDFNLEVAGPGSRCVAQLIDWAIKWLVVGLLALLEFLVIAIARGMDGLESGIGRNLYLAILGIVAFLFFYGYDIYYEGLRNGQTPGKRLCGLRVLRDNGAPIDAQAAAVRNLVSIADFLPLCYVLGGVVMMLNGRAQRLGDLAAGTIVIRDRKDELPDDVDRHIERWESKDFVFSPASLERCSPEDLHVLFSFFSRFSTLDVTRRHQLADKLCDIYMDKLDYHPESPIRTRGDVLAFLASLHRNLQGRQKQLT